MFEHACNDRIHQFDNNDSDDDLYEKEVGFTQMSDTRQRWSFMYLAFCILFFISLP